MSGLRFIGLALVACTLGACSDESKIESEIHRTQPKAEFSNFKSISPEEYADAMDEWMKPIAGSSWRPLAREAVAGPQFAGAKFFSVEAQVTNYYGNLVKSIRYCSVLKGKADCPVYKSLTSLEDAKRGAQ